MLLLPGQKVGDLPKNPDAEGEQCSILAIADDGLAEVVTVTCPAVASLTQADYVIIPNKAGATVAYWFDIDANGTAPSGAAYVASTTKTKVSVVTGNTAAQVATALAAAAAPTNVTRAAVNAVVTYTNTKIGTCVDAASHNAGDTTAGSLVVAISTQGHASALQNKYVTLNSPTVAYYIWFNVHSEGADPVVAAKTAIAVAISPSDTASTVAGAIVTALNALSSGAVFSARQDSATVYVNDAVTGNATDAADGNASLTVAVTRQGVAKLLDTTGSLNTDYTNTGIATVTPAT